MTFAICFCALSTLASNICHPLLETNWNFCLKVSRLESRGNCLLVTDRGSGTYILAYNSEQRVLRRLYFNVHTHQFPDFGKRAPLTPTGFLGAASALLLGIFICVMIHTKCFWGLIITRADAVSE